MLAFVSASYFPLKIPEKRSETNVIEWNAKLGFHFKLQELHSTVISKLNRRAILCFSVLGGFFIFSCYHCILNFLVYITVERGQLKTVLWWYFLYLLQPSISTYVCLHYACMYVLYCMLNSIWDSLKDLHGIYYLDRKTRYTQVLSWFNQSSYGGLQGNMHKEGKRKYFMIWFDLLLSCDFGLKLRGGTS